MIPGRPRLQVLLDGRDVSERCDELTFSATDQGGFEICQLGLPSADYAKKGSPIMLREGLDVAWMGRVAERSDHSKESHATRMLGGEGARALLRDAPYSFVYCDRDLTRWGDPSLPRQIALLTGHEQVQSSSVGVDPTTLAPALVQQIQDDWVSPWTPINESWYDAGPGNLIGEIYYALGTAQSAIGNWHEQLFVASDANATDFETSGNLDPSAAGYFDHLTPLRFAVLEHFNSTTDLGVGGASYIAYWQSLAVYGAHGPPGRGPDPVGFWPSDVARHALSQAGGISSGVIVDAPGYVVPHLVYRTPTPADQIVDDMAKLMGWTWGVWEPIGALSSTPRLDFRPPPSDATCVISRSECDQLDITARLGDLYDVCQVSYTDAAGTEGIATVTLPSPLLAEAGIATRTLQLDMGLASAAAASTFGAYALALSQVAARAAGSVTLPTSVRLANGGSKPALLLRPGIDRIRISDLPESGSLTDQGGQRRDVFRISRTETTVSRDGTPSTVAELDNGANLLETLQARLSVAASIVGSGAS